MMKSLFATIVFATLASAGCAVDGASDPNDPNAPNDVGDDELTAETAQDVVASFTASCDSGHFWTSVDGSGRTYIYSADATGCKRLNGTKTGVIGWNGRCYINLSNRNGSLVCAEG